MGRKTILLIVAVVIAALGATLVFLYVQGVNQRATADQKPVQVLVATAQINQGESVKDAQAAGKFALKAMPGSSVLAGALTTTDPISTLVALAPIYPGEQIISAKFGDVGQASPLAIPTKAMAISVQLDDPSRVAGFVQPGSKVAIFATCTTTGSSSSSSSSAGSGQFTKLMLPSVEVLGTGATTTTTSTTTTTTGTQTTASIPQTILTLSVEQTQAQKVILGSKTCQLSFALLTPKSVAKPGTATTSGNLFK